MYIHVYVRGAGAYGHYRHVPNHPFLLQCALHSLSQCAPTFYGHIASRNSLRMYNTLKGLDAYSHNYIANVLIYLTG